MFIKVGKIYLNLNVAYYIWAGTNEDGADQVTVYFPGSTTGISYTGEHYQAIMTYLENFGIAEHGDVMQVYSQAKREEGYQYEDSSGEIYLIRK